MNLQNSNVKQVPFDFICMLVLLHTELRKDVEQRGGWYWLRTEEGQQGSYYLSAEKLVFRSSSFSCCLYLFFSLKCEGRLESVFKPITLRQPISFLLHFFAGPKLAIMVLCRLKQNGRNRMVMAIIWLVPDRLRKLNLRSPSIRLDRWDLSNSVDAQSGPQGTSWVYSAPSPPPLKKDVILIQKWIKTFWHGNWIIYLLHLAASW